MTTPRLQGTERTLRVLDAFAQRPQWSLSDLARRLDESAAVVHRILLTMLDHGYLTQTTARGPYMLGPASARLASAASGHLVRTSVERELRQLADRTGETALYYERQGHRYVCRYRVIGRSPIDVTVQIGDTMGLHVGAGRSILAFQSAEFVDEVLAAPLMRYGPGSPATPDDVRAILGEVRRNGFARSVGEVTERTAGLSVPVPDADQVTRCVCLTTDSESLSDRREAMLVAELRHTAAAIASATAV